MKKALIINGGLRFKKDRFLLTIYSTPLARLLLSKNIITFEIIFNEEMNLFIISPGKTFKGLIERQKEKHPLLIINIRRCLSNALKNKLIDEKKQKSVKVNFLDIGQSEDVLKFNRTNKCPPLINSANTFITPSDKITISCHISGFRNKTNFNYRFNVRHKIFENIAKNKEKIIFLRTKTGEFIIKKDFRGFPLHFYKGKNRGCLAYMQISHLLITEKEKEKFLSGRRAISNKLSISLKEFNINLPDFFSTKDERELASALINEGIKIRIPDARKREADIVLLGSNVQIELTHLKPQKPEELKNSPHSEGVHINARICEGYLRVSKGIVPLYIVIFNKDWIKNTWLKDLIEQVKPEVICFVTDFNDFWEMKVSKEIKKILIERGLNDKL